MEKMVKRIKNKIIAMKSCLKQDNIAPKPPLNIILFEVDFNVEISFVMSFIISKWLKKYYLKKDVLEKLVLFSAVVCAITVYMSHKMHELQVSIYEYSYYDKNEMYMVVQKKFMNQSRGKVFETFLNIFDGVVK